MSMTGETISPTISILPDMEPIQLLSSASEEAGMTSASALPRRVTRSGVFVLLTSSSKDRHLALNLEIATSCIGFLLLPCIGILLLTSSVYHGHTIQSQVAGFWKVCGTNILLCLSGLIWIVLACRPHSDNPSYLYLRSPMNERQNTILRLTFRCSCR